jgi:hypothetical protein
LLLVILSEPLNHFTAATHSFTLTRDVPCSLNTLQPAAGLWLCDIRSAAAVEGGLVLKAGPDCSAAPTVMGIVLCRLQHAATQTLWPLMLPLHLLLPSLTSALPLPSFLSAGLSSFPLSSSPPVAWQAGVTRLTMSALPGQWASAIVVGDGDLAFTGEWHTRRHVSVQLTSPHSHLDLCFSGALFSRGGDGFKRSFAECGQRGACSLHPYCCCSCPVGCSA